MEIPGGWGVLSKKCLPWGGGGYEYFLELHIVDKWSYSMEKFVSWHMLGYLLGSDKYGDTSYSKRSIERRGVYFIFTDDRCCA